MENHHFLQKNVVLSAEHFLFTWFLITPTILSFIGCYESLSFKFGPENAPD